MSRTDSTAQPSGERQTNRTRRAPVRKTARAPFPSSGDAAGSDGVRGTNILGADLDVSDPSAGGGRGFSYQWEETTRSLQTQINAVAAGGGGGSGGGGAGYKHSQGTASTVWQINHGLGYDPAGLVIISSDGDTIDEPVVQYLVAGYSLRLSFDISIAGSAYLS